MRFDEKSGTMHIILFYLRNQNTSTKTGIPQIEKIYSKHATDTAIKEG